MMRERRTEVLAPRLSESEAKLIESMARKAKVSVSEIIRMRLFPEEQDDDPFRRQRGKVAPA